MVGKGKSRSRCRVVRSASLFASRLRPGDEVVIEAQPAFLRHGADFVAAASRRLRAMGATKRRTTRGDLLHGGRGTVTAWRLPCRGCPSACQDCPLA